MEYCVETRNLTKNYGSFMAVEELNLHIKEGDIYGMIGRNGAGKTTTLRMLSGLATPTAGEFALFGKNYETVKKENLFTQVGTLIESPGLYPEFDAFDNLKLKCLLCGIHDDDYIRKLISRVGLREAGNRKVRRFSLGMKQRLGIALALVGDPKLVILDEPINGLDPQGIVETRELIRRLNEEEKITFIISSHILGELEKIATCYGIIHEGKLVRELPAEAMEEESNGDLEEFYFSLTGGASNV